MNNNFSNSPNKSSNKIRKYLSHKVSFNIQSWTRNDIFHQNTPQSPWININPMPINITLIIIFPMFFKIQWSSIVANSFGSYWKQSNHRSASQFLLQRFFQLYLPKHKFNLNNNHKSKWNRDWNLDYPVNAAIKVVFKGQSKKVL